MNSKNQSKVDIFFPAEGYKGKFIIFSRTSNLRYDWQIHLVAPQCKMELGVAEDTLVSAEKSTTSSSLSGIGYKVKLKETMYQLGRGDLDW